MSIPSRDSFENTPESADWAQQPEGDRSWAVQDPANDPANPYGRSALFGDAVADPYAAPAADPYAPPAADAFPTAPPAAPYPAQADPFAAPAFPTTPGATPMQSNPYAQPYAAPQQYGLPYGQPMVQQPYPQQYAPFGAPVYQAPPARGLSITGMVLGIASVGLFMWAFLLPPLAGLVFSIIGLIKEPQGKGMAITGLILSGAGLLFWLLLMLGGGWFWSDYSSYNDTSNV